MERLQHNQIQYVEFLSEDLERSKSFYQAAFGWEFTLWSDTYISFSGTYVDGGFTKGTPMRGSVLVILYSNDLEKTQANVVAAGGKVSKQIFSFPGGRRFHFIDSDGNELAVWSDS